MVMIPMPFFHITGLTKPSLIASIPLGSSPIGSAPTTGPPSRFEPSTQTSMLGSTQQLQVSQPVVTAYPIDMMDLLIGAQIASDMVFHDQTMLANVPVGITIRVILFQNLYVTVVQSSAESHSSNEVNGNGGI